MVIIPPFLAVEMQAVQGAQGYAALIDAIFCMQLGGVFFFWEALLTAATLGAAAAAEASESSSDFFGESPGSPQTERRTDKQTSEVNPLPDLQ